MMAFTPPQIMNTSGLSTARKTSIIVKSLGRTYSQNYEGKLKKNFKKKG